MIIGKKTHQVAQDRILGNISSWKGLPNIGTGCPGELPSLKEFKSCIDTALEDMALSWTWQCWVNSLTG